MGFTDKCESASHEFKSNRGFYNFCLFKKSLKKIFSCQIFQILKI